MRRTEILGSFAYFAKSDMGALARRARARGVEVDFLADSGAFTAYTTGKQVSLKQYATWLQLWEPHINAAMTLDVIGDPEASARNTLELEQVVGGTPYVVPIFHIGSPWSDLERWCASHRYVALGGGVAVNRREKAFIAWMIRCHKIAKHHGAVLHGLGMTRPPYPEILPFYSVDSSFWAGPVRHGALTLFSEHTDAWVCVRDPSRKVFKATGGTSLMRVLQPEYAALVRSYGGDPKALAELDFGRISARGKELGQDERIWLMEASAEAWSRYGTFLRRRHGEISTPAAEGVGPKVYLAATNAREFDAIVAATAYRLTEGSTP